MNPFPQKIKKIAVVSPAGLPDELHLKESLALFRDWKIEVVLGKYVLAKGEESYYAADAMRRAEDFNRAVADESIDLILCSRGGYGSAQILPLIDWDGLKKRRLPVLGYSDITAIHLAMLSKHAGLPVTTQMAASLFKSARNSFTMKSMNRVLSGKEQCAKLFPVKTTDLVEGKIEGKLIAANLSLLASLCGTGFLPDFKKSILILEDVSERPRIVDRYLTQLRLAGIPDQCAAFVFGHFKRCGSAEEIGRIMERFAVQINAPVCRGLRFGHTASSLSFVCGKKVYIESCNLFF